MARSEGAGGGAIALTGLVVVYRLNNKKSGWFPSGFFIGIAGEANDWRSRPFDGGITYAGRNSNIPRLSCDSSGMSV